MSSIDRIIDISSRLEHLENAAEWIAKETTHVDNTLSQTSTLILVIADDIRERLMELVKDLEKRKELDSLN